MNIIFLLIVLTINTPKPSMVSSNPEFARDAIVQYSLRGLNESDQICLSANPKVIYRATPLDVNDLKAVFGELIYPSPDPPPGLIERLNRKQVLPMSKCPERNMNPNWYHILLGPVRVLDSNKVEVVVSTGLDGFPTVEICQAEFSQKSWKTKHCKFVSQA